MSDTKNAPVSLDRYAALFERCQRQLRDGSLINPIQVTVESSSQGGFESRIRIRDFDLTIDQPRGFEGTNLGPKPSEVLLASLAACQEITWRLYAAAHGVELTAISVELTGTQDLRGFLDTDPGVRSGFQNIVGTVKLESAASDAEIARLRDIVDAHCPVLDDLRRPVDVTLNVEHAPPRNLG